MKHEQIENLKPEAFRRLIGVNKKTFHEMISILEPADKKKKKQGGRPSKLSLEDRLLMALEYWREYRTYFHGSVRCTSFEQIFSLRSNLFKALNPHTRNLCAINASAGDFTVYIN